MGRWARCGCGSIRVGRVFMMEMNSSQVAHTCFIQKMFIGNRKRRHRMTPQRKGMSQLEEPEKLDQLLTIKQAAAYLSISDSKLYRLMRDRQAGIPVLRMPGHTTRIPAAKLQRWIEKNTE